MSYPAMLQPQIVLLREGTDTSQGIPQLVSNINACMSIVDTVRTTLGPRGMDKLVNQQGKVTISNDGATIMKLLEIQHPAAKTLVDIAKSQDAEVGDGTTSVVVLAGEFLKAAKPFAEDGVHPQIIIRAFRKACATAMSRLQELAVPVSADDNTKYREMLIKCAGTALNSKLINTRKDFFSTMSVDAVSILDEDKNLDLIGIKKVQGGAMEDSILVRGVAFKKTFSYAGFEQQPKKFTNAKVILLNVELELKSEKENAEIRIADPEQYQSIVDAEWKIIYDKLDNIVSTGANVVLSKLAIGDLATQYFADRGLFCAGRVPEADLQRVAKATGAMVQTTVNHMDNNIIGECDLFEEKQVGNERFNFFTGCPKAKTCTVVLRGGSEQFMDEAERSLHDALMIVKRAMKNSSIVAGGGAIEMELSKHLREVSRLIQDKTQLIIAAFAKALEVIPRQVAMNAGLDSIDILNKLRQKHSAESCWYGVDIETGDVGDLMEKFVWEPMVVKKNAIQAATEAACVILSIDETVTNKPSEKPKQFDAARRGRGRGRGMPRMPGM